MLYKRPYDDHKNPFIYVETRFDGSIIEEPWDKGLDHHVTFSDLDITCRKKGSSKSEFIYRAIDTVFHLYMTNSRLIFQLDSLKQDLKFKGSLIDLGIDALFKKHDDKMVENLQMIGQLRYEWLKEIMYFQKCSWKDKNMLRFCYYDSDVTYWQITAKFEHDMDVKFLANEVLHMACMYKEAMRNEKKESLISFINRYKTDEIPPAANPQKQFAAIAFPSSKTACSGKDERPITEYAY